MARDISVSIAVQGEKEFNQALRDAQSAVKVLSSELKASEAAFDESADAQAFYANKTRLINAQIEQQKSIMQALEQAVREAGEEFGDASSKTDKYRIEINRTEASIAKLERSLRETQQEAEELGRDSTRIGRQLEDGIGDAADDVSDKLEEMTRRIESDLGNIGGAVEFSAFKDAGEMVVGAFEQLGAFVEESEEYRRSMSFLEQNAMNAGFEFEYVKGLLFEAAALTGDLDGAFEGISNLLAAGFDGKELSEAIDLIGGAVIRFPETIKFENLSESLQESIATKSATGAYAETLERLGVNLDDVNEALGKAETAEQAQQVALAYLNGNGLEETVQNYKDMNADLIESETAQLNYNDALSGLAEVLTPVATAWTNFKTGFVTGVKDIIDGGFDVWIGGLNTQLANLRDEMNNWAKDLVGEENYEKWFGQEHEAGTPGEYAGLVEIGANQGKVYGSAYGAAAQAEVEAAIAKIDEVSSSNAQIIGSNVSTGVGNGIAESEGNAVSAATNLWNSIKAVLSQTITIPKPEFNAETYNGTGRTTASSYAAGGQNNTVTVITQIDGETVGNATASSVGNNLGAQAQRASTYNR